MPVMDLGMEPVEITISVNKRLVEWCAKNRPDLRLKLIRDGKAVQFDADNKTEDWAQGIMAFLGHLAFKLSKDLP